MSQVIEPAKLLGVLLGRLKDVSQNLRSDWPTSLTDKRLMPAALQSRKQRTRFCKDVFCSIEKKLLVEHGLPGGKTVSHVENPRFVMRRTSLTNEADGSHGAVEMFTRLIFVER